ncbi:MAG: exo-alpha-sialidase [Saprospiraceae bacterium]|nr:exo-alpha-sialidase [Saprospiraceae bacterium]
MNLFLIMIITLLSTHLPDSARDAESDRGYLADFILHEKVEEMKGLRMGPFVRLDDGSILTVDTTHCFISSDEGATWDSYPIFDEPEDYEISDERAILRTSDGTIIVAFMNLPERRNWNWQKEISDSPGAILPTYAMRSLDQGKSWQDIQKLHNEHCGAIRDMIETRNGNIVFTSMMMRHNPGHHTVFTYMSRNQGFTWERSNIIDLGGIGHHSGVTESTLIQKEDLSLWMLMRTNWGTFWETTSVDEGITWKDIKPTNIDASSAPGMIKRLESGRIVLVWNRRFPEGKDWHPLKGGDNQWSEVANSNHREELSIMFSEDDGKSWSQPIVFAKHTTRISYPYVFEATPGELWITTMQGGLRVKLMEEDFLKF